MSKPKIEKLKVYLLERRKFYIGQQEKFGLDCSTGLFARSRVWLLNDILKEMDRLGL